MADEKQNQYALLALVGIVAVVGIVGLTFMMVGGKTPAASFVQPVVAAENGNAAGGVMYVHVPDTYGICGEDAYLPCDQTMTDACCKAKKGNGFPNCYLRNGICTDITDITTD
jgi:hypothetical protein